MLSVQDLQRIVQDISYRPEWSFRIIDDPHEGPYLRIVATVDNGYDWSPDYMGSVPPRKKLDIGVDTYISPNDRLTLAHFLRFVQWRLQRIESHECREFLRYGGALLFDPHAEPS